MIFLIKIMGIENSTTYFLYINYGEDRKMKTNIKDVARLAGVSVSTVSNVRTGRKKVSPDIAQRVTDAIKQLNYSPNPMASGLRSRNSNIIGILIPFFNHAFFAQILRGIQDASNESGYITSVYETNNDPEKEKSYLKILTDSMVDGIILASQLGPESLSNNSDSFKDFYANKKIPIVSIDEELDALNVDSVIIDNRKAGYHAAKHLIDLGHKKIAHISGPLSFYNCVRRLEGYYDAMDEAGITPDPSWIRNGNLSPISGYDCMRTLINETEVTAVFASNDQTGIGAIKAIKDVGLRVPEDIAVIGFDNIFAGTLISPSLSTINVPTYQMGTAAMKRLLERISGKITGTHDAIELKTQIIIRKSTDITCNESWDLHGW